MVKNKKLSKSSVAIIVLALLLVASLVMGMTGAWFTDSVSKVENGLKFGTVKLSITEASENWQIDTDETGHPYLEATDMMPGDTLTGDFNLQNEGDPAYVFMVYHGEIIKALEGLTAEERADAVDYINDHKEANAEAITDADLTEQNTLEYRQSIKEDLFEKLLAAQAAARIAESDDTITYVTLPAGATVLAGYTVDGKAVSYYTLQRYDEGADVHTDEAAVAFSVELVGELFDNAYQGAEINVGVEFVAVQVANLTAAEAVEVGFGNRAHASE